MSRNTINSKFYQIANTDANLNVTGVVLPNVANIYIGGGNANQFLQTDGNGNVTWATVTSGNANANYSNANVANYLPVYGGAINANSIISNALFQQIRSNITYFGNGYAIIGGYNSSLELRGGTTGDPGSRLLLSNVANANAQIIPHGTGNLVVGASNQPANVYANYYYGNATYLANAHINGKITTPFTNPYNTGFTTQTAANPGDFLGEIFLNADPTNIISVGDVLSIRNSAGTILESPSPPVTRTIFASGFWRAEFAPNTWAIANGWSSSPPKNVWKQTGQGNVTSSNIWSVVAPNSLANISNGVMTFSNVGGSSEEPVANAIIQATHEPTGFPDPNRTQTTLSFDDLSRVFTIAPTGANFDVWVSGTKYTKTTETLTIPNVTGLYYISYANTGALQATNTYFDFANVAPVSYIYWNATAGQQYFFADERHGTVLDWQTHEYLHRTRGAVVAAPVGFNISGNFGGSGSTNANAQIGLTSGTFFDEDIEITIADSPLPAYIPVMYRNNTYWVRDSANEFPYRLATNTAGYNLNTSGVWSVEDLGDNKIGVMYVVATNDLTQPYISVMGQAIYNNINQAEAASWADLDLTGLPIFELRVLYKLIFSTNSNYTNSVRVRQETYQDLRADQVITVAGGGAVPTLDQVLSAGNTSTQAMTVGSATANFFVGDGANINNSSHVQAAAITGPGWNEITNVRTPLGPGLIYQIPLDGNWTGTFSIGDTVSFVTAGNLQRTLTAVIYEAPLNRTQLQIDPSGPEVDAATVEGQPIFRLGTIPNQIGNANLVSYAAGFTSVWDAANSHLTLGVGNLDPNNHFTNSNSITYTSVNTLTQFNIVDSYVANLVANRFTNSSSITHTSANGNTTFAVVDSYIANIADNRIAALVGSSEAGTALDSFLPASTTEMTYSSTFNNSTLTLLGSFTAGEQSAWTALTSISFVLGARTETLSVLNTSGTSGSQLIMQVSMTQDQADWIFANHLALGFDGFTQSPPNWVITEPNVIPSSIFSVAPTPYTFQPEPAGAIGRIANSLRVWTDYATRWTVAPNLFSNAATANFGTGNITGNVYLYQEPEANVYRFVPSTYLPTQDSFWANINSNVLSNLITTRAQ